MKHAAELFILQHVLGIAATRIVVARVFGSKLDAMNPRQIFYISEVFHHFLSIVVQDDLIDQQELSRAINDLLKLRSDDAHPAVFENRHIMTRVNWAVVHENDVPDLQHVLIASIGSLQRHYDALEKKDFCST